MANLWEGSGQVLIDGNGTPYASWKLYTYDTGTTTNKATYSDAGLTSANTNPVVADSNGRMGDVYFASGRYKLVFKTSADVTIDTIDPYDSSQQVITATAAPSPAYPFMEYYNSTDGHRYRRNAANSAWIDLGLVDSLGNASTVAQILAATDTTSFGTPDSIGALWQRGTDIASATTLSLPSTGGGVFNITGTTTITGIGSAVGGRTVELKFVGACQLTHNGTSFILPNGGSNITTAAGDTAKFVNEAAADATGSNWRCFYYSRASGSPVNNTDFIAAQSDQEAGSSTILLVTSGRQHFHPTAAKCWGFFDASSGTPSGLTSRNVSSITDGGVGIFTANWTTSFSSASYSFTGTGRTTIVGASNIVSQNTTQTKAAGSQPFTTRVSSTDAAADTADASFSAFGDF